MKKTPLKSIDSYLQSLIHESVSAAKKKKLIKEEDEQQAVENPAEEEKKKMKSGDITTDDVIEKLNSIRSGKSFKDQTISSSLEKYISDMSEAERTALFAFLKGISQIVTGEFDAESAVEPSDKPAGVEMKKSASASKVTIKPTVVKKSAAPEKKSPSSEDTSGPVPIKPKK
jgi:hypothetical protein